MTASASAASAAGLAATFAAAGWRVVGYDVDAKARHAAAKAGVEAVDNAEGVAREAPTVITSLPHPDALQETAEAIIRAGAKRRVIVEASTFTLADKIK